MRIINYDIITSLLTVGSDDVSSAYTKPFRQGITQNFAQSDLEFIPVIEIVDSLDLFQSRLELVSQCPDIVIVCVHHQSPFSLL